jgi:hypothetical protein
MTGLWDVFSNPCRSSIRPTASFTPQQLLLLPNPLSQRAGTGGAPVAPPSQWAPLGPAAPLSGLVHSLAKSIDHPAQPSLVRSLGPDLNKKKARGLREAGPWVFGGRAALLGLQ